MKKVLMFFLVLLMVSAGSIVSFAVEINQNLPIDVEGTRYEDAVQNLMSRGIIKGYEDGTFRPEYAINRAEACIAILNCMNVNNAAMMKAKDSGYEDLQGYKWAEQAINYLAQNGIVSGYGNGTFMPQQNVNYNELSAMLVNAMGYRGSDLQGEWPENYLNKAFELSFFKEISSDLSHFDSGKQVNRGDAVLMMNEFINQIDRKSKIVDDSVTVNPATLIPTESAIKADEKEQKNTEDKNLVINEKNTDNKKDVIEVKVGIISDIMKVNNANKIQVYEVKLISANRTYLLVTDENCKVPYPIVKDGELYCLKVVNGFITDISADGKFISHFKELTHKWVTVTDKKDDIITLEDANATQIKLSKYVDIYTAEFYKGAIDEYENGRIHAIEKGCLIRAYDITDDSIESADVIIIVTQQDAINM
ncbi:S-layer homology domain-containing protein [Anaerovorax sp. IOR16]|uniref:S-layer homology domain-containing protein n=1 Tax=Anaerovorax sp. IOR16 TaxID=2773458 RepID=UPI0019D06AFC|nr:S-layer homology domain-containing protein [Anaerovorax sp. IOR16]